MTDKPQDAKWLTQAEKEWLVAKLESERDKNKVQRISVAKSFASIKVWHLAAIYFFFQIGSQAVQFWMPQIVKGFSATFGNMMVGYILIIPPLVAICVQIPWGRHSDKVGERKYHSVGALLICVAGTLMAALSTNLVVRIAGMVLIQSGCGSLLRALLVTPGGLSHRHWGRCGHRHHQLLLQRCGVLYEHGGGEHHWHTGVQTLR